MSQLKFIFYYSIIYRCVLYLLKSGLYAEANQKTYKALLATFTDAFSNKRESGTQALCFLRTI